jgi:3-hydroxyisobutyrate dehydrogenase
LTQLAAGSDVVVTMLPTSVIVEHVLGGGEDNVFAGMKPGTIVIEMSSGVPSVTQRLAERVAALGGHMIDGPVSGGVPRAKTGELAIMVGGDAAIIDKAMPVLSAMGTVLRTGGVGSGQAMKALNNMVSTGGFLIAIEALLIGQRFGLDPAVMTDVLNAATGMNNSTQKKFRQFVLSRKFNAGFTMGLLAKDLSIAMQVGRETGTPAPLSALVQEMIVSAQSLFGAGADHTEMAKWVERLVGEELKAH